LTLLRNEKFRNLLLSLPILVYRPDIVGALVACMIFAVLQLGLPVLNEFDRKSEKEISRDNICEFIEIFLLGINAGLTKLETLNLIFETSTEPLRSEISAVVTRCNLGISLVKSLEFTAEKYPTLAPALKTISRSEITGGPITESLELELMLTRAQSVNDALLRVRSLSIKCVLPLGLCFLPAFFVVTIVPIVASLIPNIFATFR